MVNMLQAAKKKASKSDTYIGEILYDIYKKKFPHAHIPARPCRLLEAAERIAAPLLKGRDSYDDGYLEKLWIPRIRREHIKMNLIN